MSHPATSERENNKAQLHCSSCTCYPRVERLTAAWKINPQIMMTSTSAQFTHDLVAVRMKLKPCCWVLWWLTICTHEASEWHRGRKLKSKYFNGNDTKSLTCPTWKADATLTLRGDSEETASNEWGSFGNTGECSETGANHLPRFWFECMRHGQGEGLPKIKRVA